MCVNFILRAFIYLLIDLFILDFTESLIATAQALNRSDSSKWGWNALGNNQSRVLFTHANCVDIGAMGRERFQKKINWLRSVGSWFL